MKCKALFITAVVWLLSPSVTLADQTAMDRITDNVMKVCDRPEDAGKYWDMKVKGSGEAELKLKLAEFGITGGAEFSKGEWQGVKSTVENNMDYRECVKELAPLFIEKFSPMLSSEEEKEPKPRVLGGIKWLEFGLGVEMTLDRCEKQSSSVSCTFYVNANDYDAEFSVYGSSAIYDQNGNKFVSNFVSIANFKGALKEERSYLTGEIVRDVDTKITIRFSDVDESSTIISKAMVNSYIKSKGAKDRHSFEFRDIKISI